MTEPPKLFTHKPKKAKIKQFQGDVIKDINPTSTSALPPPPPPPPPPPSSSTPSSALVKESFARRYKFLWPLLLTVNLTVGAYIFMRSKKKNTSDEKETTVAVAASATDSISTAAHPVAEKIAPSVAVTTPVSAQASVVSAQTALSPAIATPQTAYGIVPEEHQRELFKWILNEKRKIKPKDAAEKKRIDMEKAVLKQFIRAESVPIL